MIYVGDFDTTETVIIPFNTFSSDDPSASVTVTNLVAGDVEIHKDGGTTQRSSDAGVTVSIDFDTVTGNHIVSIDLSDNTDAGFYSSGSRYQVRVEGVTVDGGTLNAWIGCFSIGIINEQVTAALTAMNLDHLLSTATAGADMTTEVVDDSVISRILSNGDTSSFDPSTDGLQPLRDSLATAAEIRTEVDSNSTQLAAIVADTGELQTDWANGGRLDLLIDAIKAKTDNLPQGITRNSALSNFTFLMVDETDHFTPETGLTVTGQRSLDGGALASVTGAIAEISNGLYQFDAAAGDTNGDIVTWRFSATGAADTVITFKTES